jgi:hypothetical protein
MKTNGTNSICGVSDIVVDRYCVILPVQPKNGTDLLISRILHGGCYGGHSMIIINDISVMYNTFMYFRKHYIPDLPNDDETWASVYNEWLGSQGAKILKTNLDILRNGLDFNPVYDKLVFENDADATLFLLKWSR